MARVTRHERARRVAISRGLRRYWRQVHQVEKARRVPLRIARQEVKEVRFLMRERELSFKGALVTHLEIALRIGFVPPDPEGEVAFNLRDRDQEQGFGLWSMFRGQDEVRISILSEFRSDPSAEPVTENPELVFQPGESEEEFWSNYFEAVRNYHKEWLEEQGSAPGKYERFAIFVTRMQ